MAGDTILEGFAQTTEVVNTTTKTSAAFELCPPHTQPKNGITESMIGVLTQKARAMMLDSQAHMQFWAEAINTACYLHRRTPNQSLDGKTSYEVLKCHHRLYRNGNSQCVSTASDNSRSMSTASDNSRSMSTAPGNSRSMSTAPDNSLVGMAIGNNVINPLWTTFSASDVWCGSISPKCQGMDAKMGAREKACMMLGYVHDTTKIWRIWDPDFASIHSDCWKRIQ